MKITTILGKQIVILLVATLLLLSLISIADAEDAQNINSEGNQNVPPENAENIDANTEGNAVLSENTMQDTGTDETDSSAAQEQKTVMAPSQPTDSINNDPLKNSPKQSLEKIDSEGSFQTGLYSGAAKYSLNIKVPNGINKLQPALSINYNSHEKNNPKTFIGNGWDLSSSFVQRDIYYTPLDNSDDRFILRLNGQDDKLVYVASEDRYHAENENYLFIKRVNPGTVNEYWIVKERDGKIYRLGYGSYSKLGCSESSETSRWYLDQVEDVHSNKITYNYIKNIFSEDLGALYLSSIDYNNNGAGININYEQSDNKRFEFYQGTEIKITGRIKEITTFAKGQLVNRYSPTYSGGILQDITIFGSDGQTSYAPLKFNQYALNKDFPDEVSNWEFPDDLFFYRGYSGGGTDPGVRFGDFNGDGLIDVIRSTATLPQGYGASGVTLWLNTGKGWKNETSWTLPPADKMFFSVYYKRDSGTRVLDINGDGLDDIVRNWNEGGIQRNVWINNGHGFTEISNWEFPDDLFFYNGFTNGGSDPGVRFGDFNGDGLIDVIRSSAIAPGGYGYSGVTLWLNTGKGWKNETSWTLPPADKMFFSVDYGQGDSGTRVLDINGDGLDDIIRNWKESDNSMPRPTYRNVWINNGHGFTEISNWEFPDDLFFYRGYSGGGTDPGVRFGDFNGDGLIDVIRSSAIAPGGYGYSGVTLWLNTGKGWKNETSWTLPPADKMFFSVDYGQGDSGTRLLDINGDGLDDIVRNWKESDNSMPRPTYRNVWINDNKKAGLLKSVKSSLGGETTIDYSKSTVFDNTGGDGIGDLKTCLWVVNSTKLNNNLNNGEIISTEYSYKNGKYEYDKSKREFRGFNYVEEKLADGSRIKHYYYQDDAKKGIEYQKEVLDENNNPYKRTENVYNSLQKNLYFVTNLDSITESLYDGISQNPKVYKRIFAYDNYGNIVEESSLGDISKLGDEEQNFNDYEYDTNKWIVSKLTKIYLMNASSDKLREITNTYNSFGELIKTEYWLDSASGIGKAFFKTFMKIFGINAPSITGNPFLIYNYNSYGNLISKTDENNHMTQYVYDPTNIFVIKTLNAKNQESKYDYNFGTGNLLYEIDSNGYKTEYKYDALGRKIKDIRPYDTEISPTKEYIYEFDGTAPEKVKVVQKENEQGTLDAYYYYDGSGNMVQTKMESEDARFITLDFYYDALGRLKQKSNPYYSNNAEYSTPNGAIASERYEYDTLNRKVKNINPDSTEQRTVYNRELTSGYDENNHQKDYIKNAYDEIIQVKEYNGNEIYTTQYSYDAAGNLLKIVDNQGNVINYIYDSLGRKIRLYDPDIGMWSYGYDNKGNLIKQIDNKGNQIILTYDELDRVKTKISADTSIAYTYDVKTNGTLSSVSMPNMIKSYVYDKRLRPIYEEKTIDGIKFTMNYSYDSLDRVTSKSLPNKDSVNFGYNSRGELGSISGILSEILYDEAGLPVTKTFANSLTTSLSYYPYNYKLETIKTGNKQELNYKYDNKSNVVEIQDLKNDNTEKFGYDSLDRLIKADKTDSSGKNIYNLIYIYDSIGNMIKELSDRFFMIFGYKAHAPIKLNVNETIACYKNADCGTDGTVETNCSGLNVTQTIRTFTCTNPGKANSYCSHLDSNKVKETCSEACSNGVCTKIACRDNSDCGTNGWAGDALCKNEAVWESYNNYTCIKPGLADASCTVDKQLKLKQICTGGCVLGSCVFSRIKCWTNFDCGINRWAGDASCSGNNITQSFVSYSCNNAGTLKSYCSWSKLNKTKETCAAGCSNGVCTGVACSQSSDCGTSDWTGQAYCNGKDIWQSYKEYSCSNAGSASSSCSSATQDRLKRSCDSGCSNGVCTSTAIKCSLDSDCGMNGFIGDKFCSESADVLQVYRNWTCNSKATINSYCSYYDFSKIVEDCQNSCLSGKCITNACNQNSDCGTNGWVGQQYCNGADVWQNFRTYSCTIGNCSYIDSSQQKETCAAGCSNGVCNNTVSSSIDLDVSYFSANFANPVVIFTFKIKNIGTHAASNIDWKLDPGADMSSLNGQVPSLSAGQDIIVARRVSYEGKHGTYYPRIIVDQDDKIEEYDESNNQDELLLNLP